MSAFTSNSLQNQSGRIENFEITGWEIVPYVPSELEPSNLSKEQEAQLQKILKIVVSKSLAQVKASFPDGGAKGSSSTGSEIIEAVPVSYVLPDDCTDKETVTRRVETFILEKSSPQPPNIKTRNATSLVGEVSVSFNLPNDFPAKAEEIDKLPLPEEKRTIGIAPNQRRLTFSQRLKGWKVQRRQRIKGRHDVYYQHVESNTLLRSAVEVVNFLLYEENPYKQKKAKTKSNTDQVDGFEEIKRKRSLMTEKPTAPTNAQSSRSEQKETSTRAHTPSINRDSHNNNVWEAEVRRNFFPEAHVDFLNRQAEVRRNSIAQEHVDYLNRQAEVRRNLLAQEHVDFLNRQAEVRTSFMAQEHVDFLNRQAEDRRNSIAQEHVDFLNRQAEVRRNFLAHAHVDFLNRQAEVCRNFLAEAHVDFLNRQAEVRRDNLAEAHVDIPNRPISAQPLNPNTRDEENGERSVATEDDLLMPCGLTARGINKRRRRENLNEQEIRSAAYVEETSSNVGSEEVKNPSIPVAAATGSDNTITPKGFISTYAEMVANMDNVLLEDTAEGKDKNLNSAKDHRDYVYLSSHLEECDLINHIPTAHLED